MAEVTIESLQQEVAALQNEKAELVSEGKKKDETIKGFEALVSELQGKIKEQENLLPKVHTIEIDGNTYQVMGGVRTKDKGILSAEEAAQDEDVCLWLLEMESPLLVLKSGTPKTKTKKK